MDLSKLSDAELQKLYSGTGGGASAMSDEQLQAAYSQLPQRGVMDKLLGSTGERYQTWPERLVRDALGAPKQMIEAAATSQPGSREFIENTIPGAVGVAGLATPVNPAIRAGDRMLPGVAKAMRPEQPIVPTAQELKQRGGSLINEATQSPLEINGQVVADYARKLQQDLFNGGIHPSRAGATYQILQELERAAATGQGERSFFTPANLQTLRENLAGVAQNFNPDHAKDQLAATRAIKGFDEFLRGLSPKDVVPGAPSSAPATREQLVSQALTGKREAERVAGLFERGRGDYAAAMRSNDVTGVLDRARTGILERAEGRAQAANSGRNLDNTIRSKVESVLEKPKEISGLTDDEIAALGQVVNGGAGRNTARLVGNWLGGGGGLGQSSMTALGATVGATMGGFPGAVVGASAPLAAGTGAKAIANALAKRDLNAVDELLRTRSPLYQERVANPEMTVISPEKRSALIRALMLETQQ